MDKETNLSREVLQSRDLYKYKQQILSPQNSDIPKAEAAIQDAALWLLDNLRADRKKVLIIGDYDVDGIASTAIIAKLFRNELGFKPVTIIPSRSEGYGIRVSTIENLDLDDFACIIIVDSGTNVPEVHQILELNEIPTVILDHHTTELTLPDYKFVKVVNPHLYNGDEQCSATLAYKFATVYNSSQVSEFLGLAAMATLTDCMPLHLNNHTLVKLGLKFLVKNIGINQLIKLNSWGLPTQEIVNWRIGPRLNAPGRMDKATPSLELLMCRTEEEAEKLATTLEAINQERKIIQDIVLIEATKQAENQTDFIVVFGKWHHGVAGIIASRLAEEFELPALVLGEHGETYRGSGRTCNGISLISLFQQTALDPTTYGGHNEAIGVTIPKAALEKFIDEIKTVAKLPVEQVLTRFYDSSISTTSVVRQEAYALEQLGPFGNNFPEPTFLLEGKLCQINGYWYIRDEFGKCEYRSNSKKEPIPSSGKFFVNIRLGYSGRAEAQQAKNINK